MPICSVGRDALFERLGESYGSTPGKESKEADKKFDELCFTYGVELDDVTSEKLMKKKESGKEDDSASDEIIYKIDVPANRYDILCLEGLSRALLTFLGKQEPPKYKLVKPAKMQQIIVKSETKQIRPHVVGAVLRNVTFDQRSYQSFIDLQEKLHQNICRKRTLVSIGTHDLDTIEGPFTYEALAPKDINFVPLNDTKSYNAVELFDHFEKSESHLKKFLPIIKDSPVYPVVFDAKKRVLSLPPIINGNHSKITLNTKNIFIEITATDLTKAEVVLNIMTTMFSEYCADKYSIEAVEIVHVDGSKTVHPDLSEKKFETSVDYINKGIGIQLSVIDMCNILKKMSLSANLVKNNNSNNNTISITVPPTRSDILHAVDIMEDVAIAYGYDNLKREVPLTLTYGKQQPLNKLSDQLRNEIAMAGFTEVLTFSLVSREENFKFLNKPDDGSSITISNPQTAEFQVARTSLLPGILKTVSHNRKAPLPIKVYEISDVVIRDSKAEVGAINKRNLCALYCGHTSGFEIIHGLLDTVMIALNVTWKGSSKSPKTYELKASNDPTFFPGRCADIYVGDVKVGVLGTLHPEVLGHYHITYPCAAVELFVEPFV